ncbi:hypothetical protein [Nonomuraea sp. NPDC050643]|uniref:hypothetical protein n=1 Tax=Nonomuraea sp. NPDC050643 TaxID=3155660 RepID=UPI0034116B13
MSDGLWLGRWPYQTSPPWLPEPAQEFDAIDEGELLEFAERSVGVAWADGPIPGLLDEAN